MTWKKQTEALVVGAGPVGMLTALLLVERGVEVRIIDEQWRTAARSYALALHPSSLELFDELGIAGDVIAAGQKVTTVGLYDGAERKALVDLGQVSSRYPFVLVLPQNVIEEVLESRLRDRGVQVAWNHRLAEVDLSGSRPVAQIEQLEKESSGYAVARTDWVVGAVRSLAAAYVLGTDGHRSVVRRCMGARFDPQGAPEHFAVFEYASTEPVGTEMSLALDERRTNLCWPMPGRRKRWTFEIAEPPGDPVQRAKSRLFANVGSSPFPQLDEDRLRQLLAARAPWALLDLQELLWSTAIGFQRKLADRFGDGALWLAGDAAHVARPAGVHSMNMGFLEARDLADRLGSILRKGQSPQMLSDYDEARRRAWVRLLADDAAQAGAGASAWVRSRGSRIPQVLPVSGAHLEEAMAQLGLQWSPT